MNELIVLRHENWLVFLPYFSEGAVVRTLDFDFAALPMQVDDVPVHSYQWPTPMGLYRVGVYEPNRTPFDAAIAQAGLKIPKVVPLPGADLVPDEEVSTWPGSLTPHDCPNCGAERLRVSDIQTTLDHVRVYNIEMKGVLRWEPCENHGIHAYVNSRLVVVLECISCCEHYLIGDGTENKMLQIRVEA